MKRAAALIFLLALALRLGVVAQLRDEPLFRTPQLDALEYVSWGTQMAGGDFTWPVAPIHAPGYPLLIALVLAITGKVSVLPIVQAILGSLAAVMTFAIGRRLFGPVAGVAAGVLHATYAPLILIDVSILAEGLFVFLLTATLLLVVKLPDLQRPTPALIAAGLLLGFSIIVRPTAAALIPLLAWYAVRA
ncbi:MAG TPA: glycosyltransferase family 39 protein, partial [Thermoanaerobaculia bacterium]|nr:glycosyltransferase family 39 protein [Thermoanaerobaculia bacterium]